jgi:hypothetical protein
MAADRSTAAFLTEWLAVVKNTVGAGTFERYEQYIRVHALPAHVEVVALTVEQARALLAATTLPK